MNLSTNSMPDPQVCHWTLEESSSKTSYETLSDNQLLKLEQYLEDKFALLK